jgi:hypothetical protein
MIRAKKLFTFALAAIMALSMTLVAGAAVTGAPPYVTFYKDDTTDISMSQMAIVSDSEQFDDEALTITVNTQSFVYMTATGTLLGLDIDFNDDGVYESQFDVVDGQLVITVPDTATWDALLAGTAHYNAKVDYTIAWGSIIISHPYSDIDFGLQSTLPEY